MRDRQSRKIEFRDLLGHSMFGHKDISADVFSVSNEMLKKRRQTCFVLKIYFATGIHLPFDSTQNASLDEAAEVDQLLKQSAEAWNTNSCFADSTSCVLSTPSSSMTDFELWSTSIGALNTSFHCFLWEPLANFGIQKVLCFVTGTMFSKSNDRSMCPTRLNSLRACDRTIRTNSNGFAVFFKRVTTTKVKTGVSKY